MATAGRAVQVVHPPGGFSLADAEGATKHIAIEVQGAASEAEFLEIGARLLRGIDPHARVVSVK